MERDGRTLGDVHDWFDHLAELPRGEQRKALSPIRKSAGFPSFEAVEAERELEMANSTPRPMPIGGDGAGFTAERIRHESEMTRGFDPVTMSPIPAPAEVERAERRDRELAEADKERNEARRREAERERSAATSTRWFGQ